jgi:hypothetical protein
MMLGVGPLRTVRSVPGPSRAGTSIREITHGQERAMGMVRRRTRRRTMMVAGGLAYERGRNQQAMDDTYAEQEAPPPAPPPPAPRAAPAADDATSEIERLASLHESGALTDDEFAAAKAKVLGI